ncbi:MAG: hypothetical protein A2664_03165 [Candidatus Taylorbacteria bacterium RIFCSPHIGHO2_01_FULL_46_22b]|uniref:Uncharacterized protein n=1 Tax=Candidatus Taylorbacteria bacterium RIFCSPHIGHO2_01_FULL_46_22b TaxID=1802301 RepID=A0A1G2M6C8_9BACT|nr:MAG: hypothetical protein A2664_03165 [Candidatus Taylorbacteria bacterium RIFCSPHIGHO2_01_FULL_46_22b]
MVHGIVFQPLDCLLTLSGGEPTSEPMQATQLPVGATIWRLFIPAMKLLVRWNGKSLVCEPVEQLLVPNEQIIWQGSLHPQLVTAIHHCYVKQNLALREVLQLQTAVEELCKAQQAAQFM